MNHDGGLKKRLGDFSPMPPDPDRRERILGGAKEKALARRILTPTWKWTLTGCAALLLVICLADGWNSTAGLKRLQVLLNIPESGAFSPEKAVEKEMEAYWEALPGLDGASSKRLQMALLKEKRAAKSGRPLARPEEAIYEN